MACCINLLEMRYIIEEAETSRAHPKAEKLNHILGLQKTAQLQKGPEKSMGRRAVMVVNSFGLDPSRSSRAAHFPEWTVLSSEKMVDIGPPPHPLGWFPLGPASKLRMDASSERLTGWVWATRGNKANNRAAAVRMAVSYTKRQTQFGKVLCIWTRWKV